MSAEMPDRSAEGRTACQSAFASARVSASVAESSTAYGSSGVSGAAEAVKNLGWAGAVAAAATAPVREVPARAKRSRRAAHLSVARAAGVPAGSSFLNVRTAPNPPAVAPPYCGPNRSTPLAQSRCQTEHSWLFDQTFSV